MIALYMQGWTAFDFPARKDKYSSFKWTFDHFTGVDYDAGTGKKGIFKIVGENKGWALGVDTENANYDYLSEWIQTECEPSA